MAIKTFTTGDVLTAADTNTYLNNGGLVYITTASIGSLVSTVGVSNVFSATYDNYLIQIYGYSTSANSVLWMTINGSAGSTYQSLGYYMAYGSTTLNGVGAAATSSGFRLAENSSIGYGTVAVNIFRPYLASATTFDAVSENADYVNHYQGKDTNAASSTNFTLSLSTGTISGGSVRVFGYRQA